ncbi:MAG: glucuronate isomerase [Acidobacteriia bacterium]|nr:glucuronate isomerase [Terriglobia bacterium]
MAFIHEDFLLHSESARRLYHKYAAEEPIFDYHCHLPAMDIAENRVFKDLFEIWLEGDHYKWRAMRANGVPESYCTGKEPPFEKFMAWARTVPQTLRNPLYHWTHLELKRYFGIDEMLDEHSAPRIWERANALLATGPLHAQGILKKFHVKALCTTDDPTDDLEPHKKMAASSLETRVFPAFRPDKAFNIRQPGEFNAWVDRLESVSNVHIARFSDFLSALRQRHDYFHQMGSRLSDHGLSTCYADFPSEHTATELFTKARNGQAASPLEQSQFASFMMVYFGHLDAEKGWTKQLHLGARRNCNTRRMNELGPDTGFDSIGDWPQAESLGAYLDRLNQENALPKTIVYNNNPADNYVFATMIGNFQDGSIAGKIQFGSGWWFLDQKEGIEWQINALSNVGLLSRFVGMITDSRSFMSYPRHEYFRRVLCNLLGADMEKGELPDDEAMIGQMVQSICYGNAQQFLGLPMEERSTTHPVFAVRAQ